MRTRTRLEALARVLFLVTLFVPGVRAAQRSGSEISDEEIFDAVRVSEGMTLCEMGAGDGSLSIAAARLVGPAGRVYTSELGDSRLKTLRESVERSGLTQITVVEGDPDKTNFPGGTCDAVFMRNVYHHFDDPAAMDASIATSLKPGGRVAVVDFDPPGREAVSPKDRDREGEHGVKAESVSRELKAAGLDPVSSDAGERWFIVVAARAGVR